MTSVFAPPDHRPCGHVYEDGARCQSFRYDHVHRPASECRNGGKGEARHHPFTALERRQPQ